MTSLLSIEDILKEFDKKFVGEHSYDTQRGHLLVAVQDRYITSDICVEDIENWLRSTLTTHHKGLIELLEAMKKAPNDCGDYMTRASAGREDDYKQGFNAGIEAAQNLIKE